MNHLIEVRVSHFKLLSTLNAAPLWRTLRRISGQRRLYKRSIVRQKRRSSQETVYLQQQKGEPDTDATNCPPSFFLLLRLCTWGQRYRLCVQFNFVSLDRAGWCVGWRYDSSPQEHSIFPGSWQLRALHLMINSLTVRTSSRQTAPAWTVHWICSVLLVTSILHITALTLFDSHSSFYFDVFWLYNVYQ